MAATRKTTPDTGDYEYTTDSGVTITLPGFNTVKPGVVRKIRKLGEVDQFFTVLETLATTETVEIIDEFEADEFDRFQRGWYKHAGVDLGE